MPIDPYTPCPGGTGKKVKFCCHDLLGELDKIQRMAEGEQRQNCLNYIEQLERKFPDRPCLMTIKSTVQRQLGQYDDVDQTIEAFVAKHPANVIARAEAALIKAQRESASAGVADFQRTLDDCPTPLPGHFADVISRLAVLLYALGHPLAGRMHLVWLLRLMRGDEETRDLLFEFDGDPTLPVFVKDVYSLEVPAEDVSWYGEFFEVVTLASQGKWLAAEKKLSASIEQAQDAPEFWRNLAILRSWLADDAGAVEALRKFAALDVPLEDAVEAEALAQLIDPDAQSDAIDLLLIEYGVAETDDLVARLTSDKHTVHMPTDAPDDAESDEPPPRAIFGMMDRPLPASIDGVSLAGIPRVIGQVSVYGKQTDRAARVELLAYRNERLEAAEERLTQIGGDTLLDRQSEEVVGTQSRIAVALSPNLQVPSDTPIETFHQLIAEHRRKVIYERWPAEPHPHFDGKSPREASTDASLKIPLLAEILLLEEACQRQRFDVDFNHLRAALDLPTNGPIDPTDGGAAQIPLVRVSRLECDKLSDDELLQLFARASAARAMAATRTLVAEAVKRPTLADRFERSQLYGILASLAIDARQALEFIAQARDAAVEEGKSPARWLLDELSARISLGDVEEVPRLLDVLGSRHINEPGVREQMTSILMAIGAIGPDGQLVSTAQQPAPSATAAEPVAAQPGKIWTPGGDTGSGEKPKIWTPGMD